MSSNSSELSPQMIAMIEEKRRLAIERRDKRKAIELSAKPNANSRPNVSSFKPNMSSNASTGSWTSSSRQTMTNIKPKEKTASNESPNKNNLNKTTVPYSRPNEKKSQMKASMHLMSSKRFGIDIEYNSEVVNVFRRIESRDWNPNTKRWTFDISDYKNVIIALKAITSLSIQFVDSIPDRVITALVEAKNRPKDDIDLTQRLSPSLLERLYAFQVEGVIFGIRSGGRCLIADDMGLGKTMQAIGIAQWFREDWPLLIVCPSSLRFQWKDSITDWLPDIEDKDILVVKQIKDILTRISVTIISYDLMARMRSKFEVECKQTYNCVILDESHYIKSDSAVRTEAVHMLAKTSKRVILLTGTPALSRPMELFTQIKLIDPKLFSSKHEFGLRYCDAQIRQFWLKSKYGKPQTNQKQIWDYKGAKNLDELRILLEETLLVRRLKTEVLKDLTKKRREMIIIKVNHLDQKETKKLENYKHIVKKLSFKLDDNNSLFEWYMDSALAKVEPVCNYMDQLLNQNIKLLCFCHHKQMMDGIQEILAKRLINHIRIDGSTSALDRQEACREFQTKYDCRVALLSITACATGLNLTAASVVVFAEIFWNPGILAQAEDRVHRIGQKKDVKIYYLVAKDTIDDMIWPMISKKLEILNKAGLSRDNFGEATTTMDAALAEQHLITDFFDSLDDTERKALMEDDFQE